MSREAMEAVQDHSSINDATGRNIFVAIARFIPANGGEGWASYRTIADVAGCDKDTVGRWVELIESAGELSTRKTGSGRGTKIYYTIKLPLDQPKHGAVIGDNNETLSQPNGDNSNGDNNETLSQQVKILSQQIELLSQQVQLLSQRMSQNVPTMTGTETNKPLETLETEEETIAAAPQPPAIDTPFGIYERLHSLDKGVKKGQTLKEAKALLALYSPEDIINCGKFLQTDPWRIANMVTLSTQTIQAKIDKWISVGRPMSWDSWQEKADKLTAKNGNGHTGAPVHHALKTREIKQVQGEF